MIKTRLTELFGIKYPIISAPMGPFYTTKLTVAVSEVGGLGVLSHATLRGKNSVKDMIEQLEYVLEHTDKPFGVNVRTARVQTDHKIMLRKIIQNIKQNPKLREQLVYIITSAGGSKFASKLLKEKTPDVKHFHVSPALWLVDKSFAAGCDGVCATGTEGGGHQSYEGITTMVLVSQVAQKYPEKLLVACGGIATPESVAAGLAMGADDDEKVRCVLIKSTGQRFFSAGYDLKEIQGDPKNVAIIQEWGRKVNETMVLMKKPIIAQ
ncbi:unnamed protein product, partial [marine sediment metagenome]